jgi:hypothetical protein
MVDHNNGLAMEASQLSNSAAPVFASNQGAIMDEMVPFNSKPAALNTLVPIANNTFNSSRDIQQDADVDDILLFRISELNHEGLCQATRIWEDLMERSQKETDSVEDLKTAKDIWSKYADEWTRQLDGLTATFAQKMREARIARRI